MFHLNNFPRKRIYLSFIRSTLIALLSSDQNDLLQRKDEQEWWKAQFIFLWSYHLLFCPQMHLWLYRNQKRGAFLRFYFCIVNVTLIKARLFENFKDENDLWTSHKCRPALRLQKSFMLQNTIPLSHGSLLGCHRDQRLYVDSYINCKPELVWFVFCRLAYFYGAEGCSPRFLQWCPSVTHLKDATTFGSDATDPARIFM